MQIQIKYKYKSIDELMQLDRSKFFSHPPLQLHLGAADHHQFLSPLFSLFRDTVGQKDETIFWGDTLTHFQITDSVF